ncbi:MAG: recombinase family protein [Bacteroidetes bacterium]|nr:recombinase family protein [Bacteroidota bacterium]
MKIRAIPYTRVSTDEQNNGYSPKDQKVRLEQYCEKNNIEVVKMFHDDESGKTFDRPEWKNIMELIKKERGMIDLLLFIKWDRFSRNVAEAYITINSLKKYGVEPQAIEQPLDFEIPEQKIMLAIYLAAPEVDNDRRALNIFHGIRRAKKDGRWLGACLRGYKNVRDNTGRPTIAAEGGKQEQLVKCAFNEFATGVYNIEELRKKLLKEGLNCNRNSFWKLLRNKGYIGKVLVPAYKDEPAKWVEGVHEKLIEDHVFYQVQDVLEGRRKKFPARYLSIREELPLRGHLICPSCNKILTGSSSKGKSGNKFPYYHCGKGCKYRQPARKLNQEFEELLKVLSEEKDDIDVYGKIMKDTVNADTKQTRADLRKVLESIEKIRLRLKNAQTLTLDGDLEASEYKKLKIELGEQLEKLEAEEIGIKQKIKNYESQIEVCIYLMKNIDELYQLGDIEKKHSVVSSIFPEKLIFENKKCRTPSVNEAVLLLCANSKAFKWDKKRKHPKIEVLSHGVASERFEPPTF